MRGWLDERRKDDARHAEWEAVKWAAIVLAADEGYSSALRGLAKRLGGKG